MIDQFTTLEDGEFALPTSSLDLSARMRDLRARHGKQQRDRKRRTPCDAAVRARAALRRHFSTTT